MDKWDDEMLRNFEKDKSYLFRECDFGCSINGEPVYPNVRYNEAVVDIRYQHDASKSLIWDQQAWYMTPQTETSPSWQKALKDSDFVSEFEKSKLTCLLSMPLIGEALQGQDYFSSGAFLGHKHSGLFCNTPFAINQFFNKPMVDDQNYVCRASDLPHEFSNWNDKWYSPVCRGWYKEQEQKPKQNTLSDLYIFANGSIFGMTPCAPIYDFSRDEFEAALCMDIDPAGDLLQYYQFEPTDQATYMIFNSDQEKDMSEIKAGDDVEFLNFLN